MFISDGDSTCESGSSSCLVSSDGAKSLGSPTGQLTRTQDGKLYLYYKTATIPAGCTTNATTEIIFVCPHRGWVSPQSLCFCLHSFAKYRIHFVLFNS